MTTTKAAERWQPTRAGLCNVWRYADEVLTFHRGRLLLRGANGSGKSMALELLLPFLLDASARAERLTSATRSRGGLYERLITGADGPSPVGFLWVEFASGDDLFTIGARLRASTSNHRVETTWFAAPMSVGRDLHLLDAQRVPLSVQALKEAVGAERVFESGEEYRRAVRTKLFPGFDERQYEAVITTLLALRREKISQDLSPAKLSEILTESLPPLDEFRLAEVAEGFERLDRRRDAIAQLEVDRAEMNKLGRRHRQYARLALANLVNRVRAAASERDKVTRDERAAAGELESHQGELASVGSARAEGQQAAGRRRAEIDALREHDAYKEGSRLEALRSETERSGRRAEEEDRRASVAEADAVDAGEQAARGAEGVEVAAANEARARTEAEGAADDADAVAVFAETATAADPDDAERLLAGWESAREQAVGAVASAIRELGRRIDERRRREEAVDDERTALERASADAGAARRHLEEARVAYADAVTEWATSCDELGPGPAVLAALPAPPDAPDAVIEAVHSLTTMVREARAVERAAREAEVADLDARRTLLGDERTALAAGRTEEPAPPPWRSPGARAGRAGAPLWRVVDVVAGTSAELLDRVEAGLAAAGLLDAWVTPDGAVEIDAETADAFIHIGGGGVGDRPGDGDAEVPEGERVLADAGGATLAGILRPADLDDPPVPSPVVARLLEAVALVEDATVMATPAGATGPATRPAIGRDGSFRLDPVAGRGAVAPASFIGAAAREQQRRRRIAAIDVELSELDRSRAALGRSIDEIDRRLALLESEVAALPSGAAIAETASAAEVAAARMVDGERRVAAAVEARGRAEEEAKAAQRSLMQLASTHRLPTDEAALDDYRRRVRRLRDVAHAWLRRRRDTARATIEADRSSDAARRAQATAATARLAATNAAAEAGELGAQLHALESTIGAEYRDIAARIAAADDERRRLEAEDKTLQARQLELAKSVGKLEERVAEIAGRRAHADAQRDTAHAAFLAALGDGLVADAAIDIDVEAAALVGVTAVLDAARSVSSALGDVEAGDAAVSKEQQRLGEAIHQAKQALSSSVELSFDQAAGGWWILRAVGGGLRRSVSALIAAMESELRVAAEELRADEQRLFEETLSGNVRQAVADRLRRASALIDGINTELGKVRTEAAGVGVRLKWEIDPEQPDAVRSARRLLLRDAADWTEDERTAMFAFFRARLDEARAALDGTAGWATRLREALDYRRWHRFTLEIAHRDWDGFQQATDKRLARLSTGERSIALHLPMLASVAAHYDGASTSGDEKGCPRLILLDELFAGVDAVNRAQLFGMFVTWDLDAVFTSDHEWCAYATLDGIAIHHLHAAEAGEPVTTSRFVWDGRTRTAASLELVPA